MFFKSESEERNVYFGDFDPVFAFKNREYSLRELASKEKAS